jgi:hypothetical protein
MRGFRLLEMLGHRAGEFGDPLWRTMGVFVYRLVGLRGRVAIVGRNIYNSWTSTCLGGGGQQRVDERRGHSVRSRGEDRRLRRLNQQLFDLRL